MSVQLNTLKILPIITYCLLKPKLLDLIRMNLFGFPQRKIPDQDVAQGSFIALPLTLLLLLAVYNHERVPVYFSF